MLSCSDNDSDNVYESFSSSSEDELNSIEKTDSDDSFQSLPALSDLLSSTFSGLNNFNVVHINAQSIPAHYSELIATFHGNKHIHAILVSESWLKPFHSSASYSLPGFNLIRNDRTGSRGGGVAIYLRSHIPFSIVNLSSQPPPDSAGEHLLVEATLSHTKVLVGVYYSHSLNVNFFNSFEKLLEDFIPNYKHIIIMGDFNTCLLKNDLRSSSLTSIVKASNMTILPSGATHHYPNSVPSLLDLSLVSSPDHVVKHGQFGADGFSYHDLIYISYKIRPPKAKSRILLQRHFGGMNEHNLYSDAKNVNWDAVLNAGTVDEQISVFNSLLIELYDVHAPIRSVKMKHLPAPWLTDEIKCLLNQKAAAKSRYKMKASAQNKTRYIELRNHCNRVCRDAQRRHIHDAVQNGDPAKVWNFLRSLGVGKSRSDSIPQDLDLDSLNKHFTSVSAMDSGTKQRTLNHLSSMPTPDFTPFNFSQVTACDVKKSILSITSNAVGSDSVSRKMILPIIDIILPVITHILNSSISSNTFPSTWKEAQIIPLPKKPNPTMSDYRPISILPFLSKVLERLVHRQLSDFLVKNNLMNQYQSGFRPGHSTVTALVKITDDVRLGMENGQLTILSLLDFSNAFNAVDFDILLGVLRSLNVSPTVIDWFRSYLHGRRQRVRIEDSDSQWCNTLAGVPQGGVLSPLLFAIFINSISDHLTSSYHLYADDLQIYSLASPSELHNAIYDTNCDLDRISEWSYNYGLKVNPSKTQVIILGSSRLLSKLDYGQLPAVLFDGVRIEYSKKVKNLGIIMDSCMTWMAQVGEVSRKVFASAACLRRLRNFLPTATKIALAQSLLLPILDYADSCYLDLTEEQLNKLERLQNVCIRFIYGLRKYDHVSEFRRKLKWLPIRLRRNTHILSLLYSILFNPSSPSYLKERFEFRFTTHNKNLRSTENLRINIPPHTTSFYSNSFTVQAIQLWNALPLNIRQAPSPASFKRMIKSHYLEEQVES
ncbi:hypothetical protein JYU34_022691 [Plutella xylostella]|uniref:Reverse transcriptase domain-containing protein n=1 Tax=Plutella xylostella TaxID=51655 RepID=A0ABQ7PPN6_PLUXY|nr:hypothetical protein JYU34_022691 [Plutella xylostella]